MKKFLVRWEVGVGVLCCLAAMLGAGRVQAAPLTSAESSNAVMAEIRKQKLTSAQAWEKGLLNKEILLALLSDISSMDAECGLYNPGEETFSYARVLAEKQPEIIDQAATLHPVAQIRLAQYLISQRDKRGQAVLEKLWPTLLQAEKNRERLFQFDAIVSTLAKHYTATGQYQKAADVALQGVDYVGDRSNKANLSINALRAYRLMRDEKKFDAMFDQILAYGYGWATGHALMEKATRLFDAGKNEEGRIVLQQPIAGINADQVCVLLDEQLAQSYFRDAKWDETKRWSHATLDQYASIKPLAYSGLEAARDAATNLLEQIVIWKDSPVRVEPDRMSFLGRGEAINTYLVVSSFRAFEKPIFSCASPLVTLQVLQPAKIESKSGVYQYFCYVRIAPEATRGAFDATTIEVRAKEFPDVVLRVPLNIWMRGSNVGF